MIFLQERENFLDLSHKFVILFYSSLRLAWDSKLLMSNARFNCLASKPGLSEFLFLFDIVRKRSNWMNINFEC